MAIVVHPKITAQISNLMTPFSATTTLSEPERQLLVPYSTEANAFCELGRKKIGKNEPCSPQKALLLSMVQGAASLVLIEV